MSPFYRICFNILFRQLCDYQVLLYQAPFCHKAKKKQQTFFRFPALPSGNAAPVLLSLCLLHFHLLKLLLLIHSLINDLILFIRHILDIFPKTGDYLGSRTTFSRFCLIKPSLHDGIKCCIIHLFTSEGSRYCCLKRYSL